MKKIIILHLPVLLFACSQPEARKEKPVTIQSWEVIGKDTLNRTDSRGRKQGRWLTFETPSRHKVKDTVYYKDGEIVSPSK